MLFYNVNEVLGFFLVFVRMTAFLVVSPFFSLRNIPNLAKVLFGLMLALVIFPTIKVGELPIDSMFSYIFLVISEVTVGLAIGFSSSIMFSAFRVAGQYIDLQIGYAMAQVFDPAQGSQNTVLGQFFHWLGLVVFLGINGHHMLVMALNKSFELIPLTEGKITGGVVELLLNSFAGMLMIAFQVAAPILAVLIIIDISLGMIGKTVPQINVFMTGFPLKIGLGLLTLAAILPLMISATQYIFNLMERDIMMLIRSMG